MKGKHNDFTGFTFNGIHSSELGILRVSDGSRYNENLLPAIQDKTQPIPGGDGMYFWDSNYTSRQFQISFAYDDLREEQIRKIRQIFGDKQIHELIFDEFPYKKYMVKVTGNPQLKYICFDYDRLDKENNYRIYKGEGSVTFTAYYPYGKSVYKFLDQYDDILYTNKKEWAATSGMLANNKINGYDNVTEHCTEVKVFNPGDLPTECILQVKGDVFQIYRKTTNSQGTKEEVLLEFLPGLFAAMKANQDDMLIINTKNHLIEGNKLNANNLANIYNKYIVAGDFFKIDCNQPNIDVIYGVTTQKDSPNAATITGIEYNYLYY